MYFESPRMRLGQAVLSACFFCVLWREKQGWRQDRQSALGRAALNAAVVGEARCVLSQYPGRWIIGKKKQTEALPTDCNVSLGRVPARWPW